MKTLKCFLYGLSFHTLKCSCDSLCKRPVTVYSKQGPLKVRPTQNKKVRLETKETAEKKTQMTLIMLLILYSILINKGPNFVAMKLFFSQLYW